MPGGLMHFESGGLLHEFSGSGGGGGGLTYSPDDTMIIGYHTRYGWCLRPSDILVTRRVAIGGTTHNYNPILELWLDDGAGCPVGNPQAKLEACFYKSDYGVQYPLHLAAMTNYMPVVISSSLATSATARSLIGIANIASPDLDGDHIVLSLMWRDDVSTLHELFRFKELEMEIVGSGTAQVLGTGADAADAVGVQLGSDESFVTAGAKLVSFINDTVERGFVDYLGELCYNMLNNGQARRERTLTELTTIAAAASTDTAIQIPADAQVIAVSVRVVTVIPTAATFSVGVAGATTRYGTGLSVAAGTTNPGTDDGVRWYTAAAAIRITPNLAPAAATGQVRVTIHYVEITPPTS